MPAIQGIVVYKLPKNCGDLSCSTMSPCHFQSPGYIAPWCVSKTHNAVTLEPKGRGLTRHTQGHARFQSKVWAQLSATCSLLSMCHSLRPGGLQPFFTSVVSTVLNRDCWASASILSHLPALRGYRATQDIRNPGWTQKHKYNLRVTWTDWFQAIRKWL